MIYYLYVLQKEICLIILQKMKMKNILIMLRGLGLYHII